MPYLARLRASLVRATTQGRNFRQDSRPRITLLVMAGGTGFLIGSGYSREDVLGRLEVDVRAGGIALAAARGPRGKRTLTAVWRHLQRLDGQPFAGCPPDGWEYLLAENFGDGPCGLLHVWDSTGVRFPTVDAITGRFVTDDGRPGVMVQTVPADGPLRLPDSATWTRTG